MIFFCFWGKLHVWPETFRNYDFGLELCNNYQIFPTFLSALFDTWGATLGPHTCPNQFLPIYSHFAHVLQMWVPSAIRVVPFAFLFIFSRLFPLEWTLLCSTLQTSWSGPILDLLSPEEPLIGPY